MLARAHLGHELHAHGDAAVRLAGERDLVRDDDRQEGARIRLVTGTGAWRLR